MSSYVTKKTPGDTAWFTPRPLRHVHPLGALFDARPPRVGQDTASASPEEDYDRYFQYFRSRTSMTRRSGRARPRRPACSYAVLDHQAPRGLLHVRQPVHRLQVHQHPGRARSDPRVRRRLPRRGHAHRLLLFADRLAPPGLPHRHAATRAATIRTRKAAERGPRHAPAMPSICATRSRELLTNYGKIDILWLDFSYSQTPAARATRPGWSGKGKDDWEAGGADRSWPASIQPGDHHRQPRRARAGSVDPRAVPAHRLGPPRPRPASWSPGRPARPFSGSWGYYRDEFNLEDPRRCSSACWSTPSPTAATC